MIFRKRSLTSTSVLALGFAALLLVAGCQNTFNNEMKEDPFDSLQGRKSETDHRLMKEATDDVASGKLEEAAVVYAKLHQEHPHSLTVALNYAQVLRKTGHAEQSAKLLTPYALDSNGAILPGASPKVLSDLAASDIALGQFDPAEKLLNHVLEDQNARDIHPDAYSLMGIIQDARGHHKEAEQLFRQALDGWKGDPAPVMNNLGLALASQGRFDEALETLRKALVISPNDKPEIARNIQMISDLRASVVPKAIVVVKPVEHHHGKWKKRTACPCPAPGDIEKAVKKPVPHHHTRQPIKHPVKHAAKPVTKPAATPADKPAAPVNP